MKVINHGKTYHEIKCPECKACFSYLDKETSTIYDKDDILYEGNWSILKYITCPECKNRITISLIINGKETINNKNNESEVF